MAKKYSLSYVRDIFKKQGYTLLSDHYGGNKQKLAVKCPKGHKIQITVNHFVKGVGCRNCYAERRRQEMLTPIEVVQDEFNKRGYKLLSSEYTGPTCRLKSICPKDHEYQTTLNGFRAGNGCPKCAAIKNSGPNNHNWNPNREEVEQNRKTWTAWRNLLRSAVSGKIKKTSEEVKEILGYDWDQLRDHLQNHPNWASVDPKSYHVDHIFPVCAFLEYGIKDARIICALDNLRPMAAKDNMSKNRYYSKTEFEDYLTRKGLLKESQ